MSTRLREKSCNGSYGANGKQTPSCVRGQTVSLALVFVLTLLGACSNLSRKADPTLKNLSENFQKACLSADGRGRLSLQQNRHLFQYDSILNLEERLLKMAIFFPLHGEESLAFEWKSKLGEPARIIGPLAYRFEREMGSQSDLGMRFGELWKFFQEGLGVWFRALANAESSCQSDGENRWVCEKKMSVELTKDALNFHIPLSEKYEFSAYFDRYDGEHWKGFAMLLKPVTQGPPLPPLLGLELFARECRAESPKLVY